MKYVMIIPDGMADYEISELNGKTPIQAAKTPNMDRISVKAKLGIAHTTPEGISPGSDICILSLLGYDPKKYYSGRAPLEAVSLGIKLDSSDLVLRCNLINISEDDLIMDHSAGHITTEESKEIIDTLSKELGSEVLNFYSGVSYRNILVCKNMSEFECNTIPPHNVPGKPFKDNMPSGKDALFLTDLMIKSIQILKNHPVNIKRRKRNLRTADMIWLWGAGYKPSFPTFKERFNIKGSVISAVDLIRGIGILLGFNYIDVPGITGHFDTNYKGKGENAVKALDKTDFLVVHIEAPDEAGHAGSSYEKVRAIENIDKFIIGPIFDYLEKIGDYRLIITPDHYTPVKLRVHTNTPVPFLMTGKNICSDNLIYNEKNAASTGLEFEFGHELMEAFLLI